MQKSIVGVSLVSVILILLFLGLFVVYRAFSGKQVPGNLSTVPFGYQFSPHMFVMEWDQEHGWHNARIENYHNFNFDPACVVLHYGQAIFEGMKAFAHSGGASIVLFRPRDHLQRMNDSARRLCMPEIDVEHVLSWMKELIAQDRTWVPTQAGASLYIRPTMIATETTINLKPSSRFLFFVVLSPCTPLYGTGSEPICVLVSDTYTRSSVGGVGAVKTAGNYAASMLAQQQAQDKGCKQVLWLDPVERRYVEEVGSMNIFFVINGLVVTPELTGTILPGITRRSVLELGRSWNFPMVERKVSIKEVLEGIEQGTVTEVFGTGTAAGIVPIGQIRYQDKTYTVGNNQLGPLTLRFAQALKDIQYGVSTDQQEWCEPLVNQST